jgi:hypothetical protein
VFLFFDKTYFQINKKFWKEPILYFPWIRHETHKKLRLRPFFVVAGTSLPSCYLATIGVLTDSPLIRHGPHIKWRVQQFF